MDQYRRGFFDAEQMAKKILITKKNRFLDHIALSSISLDGNAYVPRISTWVALEGFRHKADDGATERCVLEAAINWLHSASASGAVLAYAIKKQENNLQILYGGSSAALTSFASTLPECVCKEVSPDSGMWNYSGILLGSIKANHLADAIASSTVQDCLVSCISMPIHDSEIQSKISSNRALASQLDKYKSFQRFFGNASRRVQDVSVDTVVHALGALKEETEFLETSMGRGFVRAAVRINANTAEDYALLLSTIRSCIEYESNEQCGFEPIRHYPIANRCASWDACLAIPCITFNSNSGVEQAHLLTMQTVDSMAAACTPPINSYPGYFVRNYHIDENSRDVFGLSQHSVRSGINLGVISGTGQTAQIPLDSMLAHTFITGRTNTGKTTTVKKTLVELHKEGIPFLVIEAAKKEYASLLSHVPELKVYTPGTDGTPLQFNPLQPEEGTLIENHVNAVVRAITATNGGEHPIPEAFDGLLKQTYQKFGWNYGALAYHDVKKPFPTFEDVLKNVDEYIRNHAQYGPEVRQNLTAALKLRSEHHSSGALGSLFRANSGLTAKDFLSCPSVIELADFSEDSTSFLMNMLLFRIQCYLARQPESKRLNRVIVVEEAHNVFRKTISEDSSRALINNFFEKMLAEIRASGTGMIISDQRPSIMSSAVLANTAVTIVHGLKEREDREIIGNAMNLSPFQIQKLYEFDTGECIVGISGQYGVQHAKVNALPQESISNAACLMCGSRFRCRRPAVLAMIEGLNNEKLLHHIAKIRSNPYNTSLLAKHVTDMLNDLNVTASASTKCCFLGEVLSKHLPTQECRIIIKSYSDYLRR